MGEIVGLIGFLLEFIWLVVLLIGALIYYDYKRDGKIDIWLFAKQILTRNSLILLLMLIVFTVSLYNYFNGKTKKLEAQLLIKEQQIKTAEEVQNMVTQSVFAELESLKKKQRAEAKRRMDLTQSGVLNKEVW